MLIKIIIINRLHFLWQLHAKIYLKIIFSWYLGFLFISFQTFCRICFSFHCWSMPRYIFCLPNKLRVFCLLRASYFYAILKLYNFILITCTARAGNICINQHVEREQTCEIVSAQVVRESFGFAEWSSLLSRPSPFRNTSSSSSASFPRA